MDEPEDVQDNRQVNWWPLWQHFESAATGDTVTFAEIAEIGDRYMIPRIKAELSKRQGRYLESVRGVGYRIIAADAVIDEGNRLFRNRSRSAGRALGVMQSALTTDLTRYDRTKTLDHIRQQRRLLRAMSHNKILG